jgi:hypothetical protein
MSNTDSDAGDDGDQVPAKAQLRKAKDILLLRPPNMMYTGGKDLSAFLGPSTAEDPCHNKAVTKQNDWVGGAELNQSKQALAVSQALNGALTPVDKVTYHSMKTVAREFVLFTTVNMGQLCRNLQYY